MIVGTDVEMTHVNHTVPVRPSKPQLALLNSFKRSPQPNMSSHAALRKGAIDNMAGLLPLPICFLSPSI